MYLLFAGTLTAYIISWAATLPHHFSKPDQSFEIDHLERYKIRQFRLRMSFPHCPKKTTFRLFVHLTYCILGCRYLFSVQMLLCNHKMVVSQMELITNLTVHVRNSASMKKSMTIFILCFFLCACVFV